MNFEKSRLQIELLIHDLKAPLAVMESGVCSLLYNQEEYGSLTEDQTKVLKRIVRNITKGKAIVNDILEIGRAEVGAFRICSFNTFQVIQNALVDCFEELELLTVEKIHRVRESTDVMKILQELGVEINVCSSLMKGECTHDEGKFRRISQNLILNGLRYRNHKLVISLDQQGDNIVLMVADDGPGIEPKYHEAIFERYFQADKASGVAYKGYGLGLAGVKFLVEAMGGSMSLESDVGKGTIFTVCLPRNASL